MAQGTVLDAKFEIIRTMARGGMADILEARDQDGRRVAIKLLREGLAKDPEIVTRFHREGKAAAQLKSKHVVRIFEVGTNEKNRPFIVMECLEGNDLAKELDARGALPLEEAATYLAHTCHAIAEAHEAGIVHRDLKPTNLFLAKEEGDKRTLKVLDFGIAKFTKMPADSEITQTQALFGSPLYMAPETFRSAKLADVRSDVWSLGVILYECLTGVVPFQAENALGVGLAVTRDIHVPPTQRRPNLPRSVDVVVGRALKKDPAERYQSVREMLAAIEVFMPRGRNETMTIMAVTAPPDIDDDPRTLRKQGGVVTYFGMPSPSDPSIRQSITDEAPTRVSREPMASDPHDAPTRVVTDGGSGPISLGAPLSSPAGPGSQSPSSISAIQIPVPDVGETGRVAGPVSLSTPPPDVAIAKKKPIPMVMWLVPAVGLGCGLIGWLLASGGGPPAPPPGEVAAQSTADTPKVSILAPARTAEPTSSSPPAPTTAEVATSATTHPAASASDTATVIDVDAPPSASATAAKTAPTSTTTVKKKDPKKKPFVPKAI